MIDDISLADNSGESVNPTADSTFGTDSGAESNAESNAESIAEPTQDSSTGTVDRGFDVNHPMVPTAAVLGAFHYRRMRGPTSPVSFTDRKSFTKSITRRPSRPSTKHSLPRKIALKKRRPVMMWENPRMNPRMNTQ